MNDNILSIFTRRCEQAKERLVYSVKPEHYKTVGDTDVVLMKKYYGLSRGGKLILLPVFDEIKFSEDGNVIFGLISNLWTMFDTYSGQELIPQSFEDLPVYNYAYRTLEIIVDNQHHGLYDVNSKRMILKPEYDDVDCSTAFSHLWVRKGRRWGFVNKTTCQETLVYDMDMAYEADGGLFLRRGQKIIHIDERGISDEQALRRFVLSHKGRGVVHNAKYHDTTYFDIYGNIIN